MKKLSQLLTDIFTLDSVWDREIFGLALDSRQIKPGYLFFACRGTVADGKKFIDAAINQGAVAIFQDTNTGLEFSTIKFQQQEIPIISIPDLKQQISEIAARFYEHPSRQLTVIAVTGTNGKTSCCHFIAQALTAQQQKVGILGTVGNGIWGKQKESSLTTQDPIELQRYLAEFKDEGVDYVVMEASSHGIVQGRLNAIAIDIAIFTNLTRDHLDYHGDMVNYSNAKRRLFLHKSLKYAVINIDDDFGRVLVDELSPNLPVYTYSALGRIPENKNISVVRVQQTHLNIEGSTASIHSPWGDGLLHTKLLGRFNLSNLLAAFTALGILRFSFVDIINLFAQVKGVTGRMELLGGNNKPYVIVDYAHTPDALKQVLSSIKEYLNTGELWCVFGCGGNRDQGKRAQMGLIAENFADHIIVTDDNPRHEEPQAIVADILQGMVQPESAVIEHDRRRAIAHAIQCAKMHDIVLIAGKGHETYQQYGDEKILFNDKLEVQLVLAEH